MTTDYEARIRKMNERAALGMANMAPRVPTPLGESLSPEQFLHYAQEKRRPRRLLRAVGAFGPLFVALGALTLWLTIPTVLMLVARFNGWVFSEPVPQGIRVALGFIGFVLGVIGAIVSIASGLVGDLLSEFHDGLKGWVKR